MVIRELGAMHAMVLGGVETAIGWGSSTPNPAGVDLLMKKGAVTMPRMGKPEEVAKKSCSVPSVRGIEFCEWLMHCNWRATSVLSFQRIFTSQ